jgi:hypothetical protein
MIRSMTTRMKSSGMTCMTIMVTIRTSTSTNSRRVSRAYKKDGDIRAGRGAKARNGIAQVPEATMFYGKWRMNCVLSSRRGEMVSAF